MVTGDWSAQTLARWSTQIAAEMYCANDTCVATGFVFCTNEWHIKKPDKSPSQFIQDNRNESTRSFENKVEFSRYSVGRIHTLCFYTQWDPSIAKMHAYTAAVRLLAGVDRGVGVGGGGDEGSAVIVGRCVPVGRLDMEGMSVAVGTTVMVGAMVIVGNSVGANVVGSRVCPSGVGSTLRLGELVVESNGVGSGVGNNGDIGALVGGCDGNWLEELVGSLEGVTVGDCDG
jgi:hypothetical protein